jgi:hypothetical protein
LKDFAKNPAAMPVVNIVVETNTMPTFALPNAKMAMARGEKVVAISG